MRHSSEGSVLRAETEHGIFYMKSVPAAGPSDEVLVSSGLSEVLPEYFAKPVATEERRRWMLMEDYGPTFKFKQCMLERDPELFKKILTHWCRIQLRSVDLKGKLLDAGCPELSTKQIIEQAQVMVKNPEWFLAQEKLGGARKDAIWNGGVRRKVLGTCAESRQET